MIKQMEDDERICNVCSHVHEQGIMCTTCGHKGKAKAYVNLGLTNCPSSPTLHFTTTTLTTENGIYSVIRILRKRICENWIEELEFDGMDCKEGVRHVVGEGRRHYV